MTDQLEVQSKAQWELASAAFTDTEATIRATDTKASIALVVHGFIFTGVLSVLSRLGTWFEHASCSFRALVIVLASATALAFIVSVAQLLRCVKPAPASAIPQIPLKDVFYLPGRAGPVAGVPSGGLTFDQLKARLGAMTPVEVSDELIGELVKISAIRARKVALAQSGLGLLGVVIGLATVLLGVLAIHQL